MPLATRRRAAPSAPARPHRSLLRPLGIVGYDAVEPALLAALATEEPLLLVSDHGAAKTLLLVRLAEALGLELRHYNASLLQFDDLAGFPIPCEKTGAIRYAAPPGAIWGAEVVFFDEIGRCRAEMANKLFPIVHERRIQGLALERLRYRWAATNPPAEALASDRADDPYEGVEQLDPALADRFAYVLPLPRFAELSDDDRAAVVRGVGERAVVDGARQVRELVEATRDLIGAAHDALREGVVAYVLALAPRLEEVGVTIGGRRAATLARNLLAVHAACVALGRRAGESAFSAALLASVPDVVRRPVSRAQLLAAHRAAWDAVRLEEDDPRRLLEGVREPLRRATLAITLPDLPAVYRGESLCGALAAMPTHEREIAAWLLLPRLLHEPIVPATAVETVGDIVAEVAKGGHAVRGYGVQNRWVADTRAFVAEQELPREGAEYLFSVVCRAFPPRPQMSGAQDGSWREAVERCLAVWRSCEAALGGASSRRGEAA